MGAAKVPVTIITGFLGSGKTTIILKLLEQLPRTYRLALLKNEFGDVAVDSQLATNSAIGGVRELLNGCICCNLVGQLADALQTLHQDVQPDHIVIETSGSAFPATLAMEVNRLARDTGAFILDGVISVIDVENWKGYEDTSYTARLQAKYTDLIIFNKWERAGAQRYEDCLDRVGDLELDIANIKSQNGKVEKDLLLGLGAHTRLSSLEAPSQEDKHASDHQSEVEVLSISLCHKSLKSASRLEDLMRFLQDAPKDEIYRIKGIIRLSQRPMSSDDLGTTDMKAIEVPNTEWFALNWAFGRWTFTSLIDPLQRTTSGAASYGNEPTSRLTVVLSRSQADRWSKLIKDRAYMIDTGDNDNEATIERLA